MAESLLELGASLPQAQQLQRDGLAWLLDQYGGNVPTPPERPLSIGDTRGMTQRGNIDLTQRPVIRNPDGSISTVRSLSFNDGRGEVLIPTVVDGRVVSDREAIDHYYKTGQMLGAFDTPAHATHYSQALHRAQADYYGK